MRFALGRLGVAVVFGSAAPVFAQQFVEQQSTRFPQPPLSEYTNQVALADFDGDGDLDIAFANGGNFSSAGTPQRVRLFINNGSGVFADQTDARTGGLTGLFRDVEFGDVDGDGDLDMALAQDFLRPPRLLLNNGTGFFTDITGTAAWNPGNLSSSHAAFGDIENDGDLDLLFTHGGSSRFGTGQTQLFLNNGSGSFTNVTAARLPVQTVPEPMDCQFGDIDGDRDLDIVIMSRGTNGSKLYRNNGSGFFTDATVGNLPPNAGGYAFDMGDLNGDNDLDLIGINANSSSARDVIFDNNGSGSFSDISVTALPGTSNPNTDDNDSRFADLDYDGDLDLVIASLGSTERANFNVGGVLTLAPGTFTAIADASLDIEVGDLTGDGKLDAVTAQGESGSFTNRIYINNGAADNRAPRVISCDGLPDAPAGSGPFVVRAVIRDDMTTDSNFFARTLTLRYTHNAGGPIDLPLQWSGGDIYRGVLPALGCGSVTYEFRATDWAGNLGVSTQGTFDLLLGPPDLTGDNLVDQADLAQLLSCYDISPCGDVDNDGDTDQADLAGLLAVYGTGCP